MFLGVTEKYVRFLYFLSKKRSEKDMKNLYTVLTEKLYTQMKIMDTTIKGIKDSKEYQDAISYNEGIRAVKGIIDQYAEILTNVKM